jgi:hypothetical protein
MRLPNLTVSHRVSTHVIRGDDSSHTAILDEFDARPHSFPRLDGVEAVREELDPVGTFLPTERSRDRADPYTTRLRWRCDRKADESRLSRSWGQRNIPRFGVSAMEIGDELLHVVWIMGRGIPLTHQNDRLVQGGARNDVATVVLRNC